MSATENRIETPVADLWMDQEGIVRIRFKPTTAHGSAEASGVVKAHNELAADVPCLVLADIQDVTVGANRAARQHYVSSESSKYKLGMAMLVQSPMQRMLGNIFLRINRPPYPTRLFSREQEALQWLREVGSKI